ncbi:DUF1292 domain-containing protein [Haloimpatiens sp. FM7315]|uniref:DUF1292 domain-containing protein n=1 Tax=Haloimpatiens sp. FM7315 TaxID=3298609 RepID=UPI00370A73DA
MGKLDDFIQIEKSKYGSLFSDIEFAINSVSELLSEDSLKERKYYTRVPILKKYIELLDSIKLDKKRKSFLSFFDQDKYINILEDYKKENKEIFLQLECCSKCKCLNCTRNCGFDSCKRCTKGSRIYSCDHTKTNVSLENRTLNLLNEDTNEDDIYYVLAIIQTLKMDTRYIVIKNSRTKEKYILYYYPGISEDSYAEITKEEDFNFAASTYDSLGID